MPSRKWDWACFISYKHIPADSVYMDFITELKNSLFAYINIQMVTEAGNVFRDRDKFMVGDEIDPSIAKNICNSLTLVPIYMQRYFSPACIREFEAMLRLEKHRVNKQNNPNIRLIIPIVLTEGKLPPYFASYWCVLFPYHNYRLAERNKQKRRRMIDDIAHRIVEKLQQVYEFMNALQIDPCSMCETFELISEQEAKVWFEQNRAQFTNTPDFPR